MFAVRMDIWVTESVGWIWPVRCDRAVPNGDRPRPVTQMDSVAVSLLLGNVTVWTKKTNH